MRRAARGGKPIGRDKVWATRAWATVDNALMRFRIVDEEDAT